MGKKNLGEASSKKKKFLGSLLEKKKFSEAVPGKKKFLVEKFLRAPPRSLMVDPLFAHEANWAARNVGFLHLMHHVHLY